MPRQQVQSRKVEVAVETPEGQASRKGNWYTSIERQKTIPADDFVGSILYTNNTGEPQYVTQFTFSLHWEDFDPGVNYELLISDDTGTTQIANFGHTGDRGMHFPGGLQLRDGWEVSYNAYNPSTKSLDYNASVMYRDEIEK